GYVEGAAFWVDFFLLTGIFVVTLVVMRTATDFLSKNRVAFPPLMDYLGGAFFALWTGWVLVCFLTAAMQTAPLARNFFFEGFRPGEDYLFGMLQPDEYWLAFTQRMSMGPMAPLTADSKDAAEKHVFDPKAEFIPKYASRREEYASPLSVAAGLSGVMKIRRQ
ncbi:MAG: hypothetical protein N2C14_13190, partial [Planctomycetales bacterium]